MASLQIGAHETTIVAEQQRVTLPLGSAAVAQRHFRRWPPTALEMEDAIGTIEDALAEARPRLPAGLALESADADVLEIARQAGLQDPVPMALGRESVERVFNWLADVAEGAPATAPVAAPLQWAATLVILREMMHHWGLEALTVRAS